MHSIASIVKGTKSKLSNLDDLPVGITLWISVSLTYVLLAWGKGVWTTHDAALMWWNSVDDAIPELTAKWLVNGGQFLEGWSPFDRGPLQPFILIYTGSIWMGPEVSYVIGILLNGFWVFGLYILLREFQISKSKAFSTVIAVSLVGPVWINTVYPWPKLLGAGLTLLAFAMLFKSRYAWSSVYISLALIAHGSSLFAFVVLVFFAIFRIRNFKVLVYGFALIPALLWNSLGTLLPQFGEMRLTQWHFAGTDITEPENRNPVWSVVYQYTHNVFNIVSYKLNNVLATLGILQSENSSGTPSWWSGTLFDQVRATQMMSVILAPGVLLVGIFKAKKVPPTLWLVTLSMWMSYVLLEWEGHLSAVAWLHTAPLALLVLLAACLALPFKGWFVLPMQVIYFLLMWFIAIPVTK